MPPLPPLGQHTFVSAGARELRIEIIGEKELQRKLQEYGHIAIPKATARALNSTAVTVRKETIKVVAKRMGLKQKDVRDKSKIRRADKNRLEAVIRFEGRKLNLIRFKARQTKRGVSVAPWGRRHVFPGTFIVTIDGVRIAMKRARLGGKRVGRTPIVGLRGPGIAQTAALQGDPAALKERERLIAKLLPTRLKRELEFQLSKLAQRGR